MSTAPDQRLTRRGFIARAGLLSAAAALATGRTGVGADEARRFKLICFIKPFERESLEEIADAVASIGWQGVECAVREKSGTIQPERVEEDLPKFAEILRQRNLNIAVLATDIESADDPLTRKVLRTARRLGIQRYRVKHWLYDLKKPIAPQLDVFKHRVADLAKLNEELKVTGSLQNHSGANYTGAPVWDIWEMLRGLDPNFMGIQFDIGHATLEGGLSWPLQARLMEPFFTTISVKDFLWKRNERGQWRDAWVPLGEGMVQPQFFDFLKRTGFRGPVSQHFEYELGAKADMLAAMKKDFATLRKWIGA